jgi:hypothetical protein
LRGDVNRKRSFADAVERSPPVFQRRRAPFAFLASKLNIGAFIFLFQRPSPFVAVPNGLAISRRGTVAGAGQNRVADVY